MIIIVYTIIENPIAPELCQDYNLVTDFREIVQTTEWRSQTTMFRNKHEAIFRLLYEWRNPSTGGVDSIIVYTFCFRVIIQTIHQPNVNYSLLAK